MMRIFYFDGYGIAYDIRNASLDSLFHPSMIQDTFKHLQIGLFKQGYFTTGDLVRSLTHLLIDQIFEPLGAPDITPEGINDKIFQLFAQFPRHAKHNIQFYGIRCGLVYGAMAVYESEMRDRWPRKFQRGSSTVIGASATTRRLRTIHGEPVGTLIQPAVTRILGVVLDSFGRKGLKHRKDRKGRKGRHLAADVGQVHHQVHHQVDHQVHHQVHHQVDHQIHHRFLSQVIGEANQGLLASYGAHPVYREEGDMIPPYSPEQLECFKQTAWEMFQFVLNEEGRTVDFKLPPTALEAPQLKRWLNPKSLQSKDIFPLVSADFYAPLGFVAPHDYDSGFDLPDDRLSHSTFNPSSSRTNSSRRTSSDHEVNANPTLNKTDSVYLKEGDILGAIAEIQPAELSSAASPVAPAQVQQDGALHFEVQVSVQVNAEPPVGSRIRFSTHFYPNQLEESGRKSNDKRPSVMEAKPEAAEPMGAPNLCPTEPIPPSAEPNEPNSPSTKRLLSTGPPPPNSPSVKSATADPAIKSAAADPVFKHLGATALAADKPVVAEEPDSEEPAAAKSSKVTKSEAKPGNVKPGKTKKPKAKPEMSEPAGVSPTNAMTTDAAPANVTPADTPTAETTTTKAKPSSGKLVPRKSRCVNRAGPKSAPSNAVHSVGPNPIAQSRVSPPAQSPYQRKTDENNLFEEVETEIINGILGCQE